MNDQDIIQAMKTKYPKLSWSVNDQDILGAAKVKHPNLFSDKSYQWWGWSDSIPKDFNFFDKVGNIFQERGKKIWESFGRDQTRAETALQTVWNIAWGAGDVAWTAIIEGVKAVTPDFIENSIKEGASTAFKALADTELWKKGLSALQGGIESYNKRAQENPRAAADLWSVVDIASVFPVWKWVGLLKQWTKQLVETWLWKIGKIGGKWLLGAVKGVREGVEWALEKQVKKETLDIVSPTLSKTEQIAAFKKGTWKRSGILGEIKIEPSKRDLQVVEATKDLVSKKKNEFTNIDSLRSEIARIGKDVEKWLKENDAVFSRKELASYLNKVEKPASLSSDSVLNKTYDTVKDKIVNMMSDKKAKLSELLKARKEFDKIIEKDIGSKLYEEWRSTPIGSAIKDLRRKMNDFISEKLPKGNTFKESLKKQNLLYDAIDNIAEKAPKVWANRLTRLVNSMKNNIVNTALIGVWLGGTSIGALIWSPALIAWTAIWWLWYWANRFLRSKWLKKTALEWIKRLESALSKETNDVNKKAITDAIDWLQDIAEWTILGSATTLDNK